MFVSWKCQHMMPGKRSSGGGGWGGAQITQREHVVESEDVHVLHVSHVGSGGRLTLEPESNTTCLEPVFFRGSQPGCYVNRKHAAGQTEDLERHCGTNWNN